MRIDGTWHVCNDGVSRPTVVVRVAAPLTLPLRVPGVGAGATVTGTAAAVVDVGG